MMEMAMHVVSVTGLVDERWERRIAEALAHAAGEPLVIDLSDAILVSRSPLARALHSVGTADELAHVSVICPRISAAMLLRRWRVTELVRVYASVQDCAADQRTAMTADRPPVS